MIFAELTLSAARFAEVCITTRLDLWNSDWSVNTASKAIMKALNHGSTLPNAEIIHPSSINKRSPATTGIIRNNSLGHAAIAINKMISHNQSVQRLFSKGTGADLLRALYFPVESGLLFHS